MRPSLTTAFLFVLLAGACSASDEDPADDDEERDWSQDSGGDDGDSGEGGTQVLTLVRLGSARAGPDSFAGTEESQYSDADGEIICVLILELGASSPRTDCAECDWAHDVSVSGAAVERQVDGACAEILGGEASVLVGTSRGLGFQAEYLGHADVLMVESDSDWGPNGYAEWDSETEDFLYDWDVGEVSY